MAIDLSIIIPVYNAMPYFTECIESITSQDIAGTSLEVILIDDGSTDGSGEYCDQVAAKHSYFKTIHQPNSGGASQPRNVGIEAATGEFIFFCDADDAFYPNVLRDMIAKARELQCDMGLFKIDARDWKANHAGLFSASHEHCTLANMNLADFYGPYRLIKRSLIEENGIRFIEDINPEDWAFSLECYLCAQNICVISDRYYYRWRKRDDRQSRSFANIDSQNENWETEFRGFEEYVRVAERYDATDRYPRIMQRLCRSMAKKIRSRAGNGLSDDTLDAWRELVAPHLTDNVKRSLSLSVLVSVSALCSGLDAKGFAAIIPIDDRLLFFSPEGDPDARCIAVFDKNGQKVVDVAVPSRTQSNLAHPKYTICPVEQARFEENGLVLSGTAFLLRENARKIGQPSLRASSFKTDYAKDVPASLEITHHERAYDNVWEIRFTWTALISYRCLEELAGKTDGSARIDFRLIVPLESGAGETAGQPTPASIRLGKRRTTQAEHEFLHTAAPEQFEPVITGQGNLSVQVSASRRERFSLKRLFKQRIQD